MKKLLKINVIAIISTALLSSKFISTEPVNVWMHLCWFFLFILNIHLACIFAVAVIGWGSSLIMNSFLPVQDRFIDPPSLNSKPNNELNTQSLIRKDWFSFFTKMIGISLVSMLMVVLLRVYLKTCGTCFLE